MSEAESANIGVSVHNATVPELLAQYGAILDELRRRQVVRSSNGPVSDYAELLCCRAFGWTLEANSRAGFDATDAAGVRFQIKARRLTAHNTSRQLSSIRKLDCGPFDQLAGLLFNSSFAVIQAAIVPLEVVKGNCKYVAHTNSWRFLLRDKIWEQPGVLDVTPEVRSAAAGIR